jgi:low temperature requirement protein LtrA
MVHSRRPLTLRHPDDPVRKATWLELFFDLVFVVAITALGHRLADHPDWIGLLQFLGLLAPVWWCWVGHTVYANRFDSDDVPYRFLTLGVMLGALVMAVEIPTALAAGSAAFAMAYVFARVCLLASYWRARTQIPAVRHMTTLYLAGFGTGAAIWAVSIAVPAPYQYMLWALGLLVEFATPWLARPALTRMPLDTRHLPERFGLFFIVVLGESVLAVAQALAHVHWKPQAVLAAVCAFVIAVSLWWKYFDCLESETEHLRVGSGQPYIYTHLPIVVGVAVLSIGLEKAIEAASASHGSTDASRLVGVGLVAWLAGFLMLRTVQTGHHIRPAVYAGYAAAIALAIALAAFAWPLPGHGLLASVAIAFVALTAQGHIAAHRHVSLPLAGAMPASADAD